MTEPQHHAPLWATSETEQCVSQAFMSDMHWGAVGNRCERIEGHELPHMSGMRATNPVAVLCWPIEEVEARA